MLDLGTGPERRQEARFALNLKGSAEVLYRRPLDRAYDDPTLRGQERFKVESINVSRGGMMLAFDVEVSAGDVLRIRFVHPVTKAEIPFEAHIAWMRKNASPLMGKFCAGMAFRNRDEDAITALVDYAKTQGTIVP